MRKPRKKRQRRKFGEGKLGIFLKEKAPKIFNVVGDLLPDKGVLGIVKNLISKDETLSEADKAHALELLEFEMQEIQEVTKRWGLDATSDSWLSKNVRPLTLVFLLLFMSVIVVCDSIGVSAFEVKDAYISLIESLLLTTVVAYFGSRGVEKYQKIRQY